MKQTSFIEKCIIRTVNIKMEELFRAGAVSSACLFENNRGRYKRPACQQWSCFCEAYISATTCPFGERVSFVDSHILSTVNGTNTPIHG